MLAAMPSDAAYVAALGELQRLGLGLDNARILYDMLRCARCRTVRGLAGGSNRNPQLRGFGGISASSTFFKNIVRLHHQLRDRGVVNGSEIEGLPGGEKPVTRQGTYWTCDANGTKRHAVRCIEYVRGRR